MDMSTRAKMPQPLKARITPERAEIMAEINQILRSVLKYKLFRIKICEMFKNYANLVQISINCLGVGY